MGNNIISSFSTLVEADWLAMATIDAFFSWTEHIFIHLAVLVGNKTSAQEVASLAQANWATKFKAALDVTDPDVHRTFSALLAMRKDSEIMLLTGPSGNKVRR